MSTPTPEQLRNLLLHQLPEEEAQRLEEQLMQDGATADLLRHEETDLVDDYVRGHLAANERQAFEQHLLADPAIRRRVKIARALQNVAAKRTAETRAAEQPARKMNAWNRWPLRAAAAFAVCAFAIGLALQVSRQSEPPAPKAADRTPDAAVESAPTAVVESPASIVLLADIRRGGEPQTVQVHAGAREVRLQAEATSSDSSVTYRLSIADEAGAPIFSANDLQPRESGGYVFVETEIPAGALGTGHRIVTLEPQRPGVESFTWQLDVQPAN